MAIKVPHFHRENPAEFRIWCAMAHEQVFIPVCTVCVKMFILRQAEALQSIKHANLCRIHGETCH